jgi:chromate transporter
MHGRLEIFLTFARVAAMGFGGVNFWLRRVLVQEKRWIDDREFIEGLALGQILPGPNAINLSLMLGHRFGGTAGAFAALSGLMLPPLAAVIALALLYRQYGELPMVEGALRGMTFVVGGLLLANAAGIAVSLPRRVRPWLFLVVAFGGVGLAGWPLVMVMGALAPLAIGAAWKER